MVKVEKNDPHYRYSAKKRAGRLIESGGRRVRTRSFWFEKFPFLGFLAGGYDLDKLTGDCIAGLTTALTVIPQGIGYAPLAGLPLQVRGREQGQHYQSEGATYPDGAGSVGGVACIIPKPAAPILQENQQPDHCPSRYKA